jgi:type I restriction enzyme S subunit
VIAVVNGYPFDSKLFATDNGHPLIRIRDIASLRTVVCYDGEWIPEAAITTGDILIGMDGDFNVARWKGGEALLNQRVCCVRTAESIDPGYLYYILPAPLRLINEFTYSTTVKHLSSFDVLDIRLPYPPIEQQRLIADYLERETGRIDGLVAEKERMLALLEEKRAALISRVVTRGLDLNTPLKPSGQEWLGEIPAHWRVERAKNLFTVRDDRSDDGSEELLTVSHITGVTSRAEKKDVYMFEADDKAGYKRCMPGDLAINTLWAWMGAMGISPLAGIVSPDYHVYFSTGQLLPQYVDLLCRARPFVAEVSRWSKGVWSSRLRLYPENFFEMRLPVPPQDEQLAIVRAVEKDQRKANALSDSLQLSITLAKERRATLITAAVTGQIPQEEMR